MRLPQLLKTLRAAGVTRYVSADGVTIELGPLPAPAAKLSSVPRAKEAPPEPPKDVELPTDAAELALRLGSR